MEPRNLCQNLNSQNPSWKLRTCRNLYLEPNCLEPRNLPEPLLGTLLGTSEPAGTFARNPSWNLGTCPNLYLKPLLGTSEPAGTFARNPSWNLGTFRNLYSEPFLEPRNLPGPLLGTLLGTSEPWNLLEPLLGTFCLEPWKTCRNLDIYWNPDLEPRNLPEPLLENLAWNLGTFVRTLTLRTLLGNSEPAGTFTWNPIVWNLGTFRNLYSEPFLEPRNLPEPLLGTLLGTSEPAGTFTWNPIVWNLGTCRNLYSELFLEPRNLPEPLLGTLLGTSRTCPNLYLKPLLGTSEPAGTFARNPSWNLGTFRNLYSEPFLEPRNLPGPLLGTLLGTSEPWNLLELYLEPFAGTLENLPEP